MLPSRLAANVIISRLRFQPRLFLSPPHIGTDEKEFVRDAFETNWIAPVGPHIDAFEREFAQKVGAQHAVALSSGTAALHLAVRLCNVGDGDEVLVSSLTFCASVNPILYEGGVPVFIDSALDSWNLDPNLVEDALRRRAARGKVPKALIAVHLYGQSADIDALVDLCTRYEILLIEDAAESLGATYRGRSPGTFGKAGIFSFNGNKIITTSGGGMLVTDDEQFAHRARKLATQARDDAPHYEHSEIGYNYRLSNVLAGIGRGQLRVLDDRVAARRRVFEMYRERLGDLQGITFMPEAPWGRSSRWLTCILIDPQVFGADREQVRLALEAENIESRPVWKPMHLQPAYQQYEVIGGSISEALFRDGLCLPSGSSLSDADIDRISTTIRNLARNTAPQIHTGGPVEESTKAQS